MDLKWNVKEIDFLSKREWVDQNLILLNFKDDQVIIMFKGINLNHYQKVFKAIYLKYYLKIGKSRFKHF